MDISVYISELLYEQDCIIIPGFGGLVCNYKPATIHPTDHILSPPSKAITFNKSLQTNDGLLINHIAHRQDISFDAAAALVKGWVSGALALLHNKEQVTLPHIGYLYADAEQHIHFEQNPKHNYLKSAFGLKEIKALPVIRPKELRRTEAAKVAATLTRRKRFTVRWKVAALVLAVLAISALARLMWSGIEIKSLNANEAGITGFLSSLLPTSEAELKPLPFALSTTPENAPTEKNETIVVGAAEESLPTTAEHTAAYYIIVGAFKNEQNVQKLREQLAAEHRQVITDPQHGLTRVGYFAGSDWQEAREMLTAARQENVSCWLLKK